MQEAAKTNGVSVTFPRHEFSALRKSDTDPIHVIYRRLTGPDSLNAWPTALVWSIGNIKF